MIKKLLNQAFLYQLMKRSLLQLTLAVICTGISLAHTMKAQNVLNQSVKIHVRNQTFDKTLLAIEKKAQVKFAYRSTLTQPDNSFTLESSGEPLSDLLGRFLNPLKIKYEVSGEHIVLRKTNQGPEELEQNRVVAERTLTGTVMDEKAEPLPGSASS